MAPQAGWASRSTSPGASSTAVAVDDTSSRGFYGELMRQGSNLVPRVLLVVDELPPPAMGLPAGLVAVESRRSNDECPPWKQLASLTGVVESRFVCKVHLGETLMPFRLLKPIHAVVPFDSGVVLDVNHPDLDDHPNLAAWWRNAERLWASHRSEATKLSLAGQIDYQSKLTNQYPPGSVRVIYTGRGSRVAAAVETDDSTLVDHALYWAAVETLDEGRYLVALLNSDVLHNRVADFYSRGQFGARNIHKAAFGIDISRFDATNPLHAAIVALSQRAETVVAGLALSATRTSALRTLCRATLTADGVMAQLDVAIADLIPAP